MSPGPTCCRTRPTRERPAPGLTGAQRAGLAEALIAQLRQVNARWLAVADGLSRGTIDILLATSGLKLSIQALMRGMQP